MKTVVNNKQVAHLWANQSQPEARGSNFFFRDSTIFSYGEHFPIAKFHENKKGRVCLFTTRNYSITTSKHKGYVLHALSNDVTPVYTSDVLAAPRATLLDEIQARIDALVTKAEKARSSTQWIISDIERQVVQFNTLAPFVSSKRKPNTPAPTWYEAQKKRVTAYEAKKQARDEARRLKAQRSDAEKFNAWFTDTSTVFPYSYRRSNWHRRSNWYSYHVVPNELGGEKRLNDTDYMRVKGDEVDTSQGARVPKADVIKALPIVLAILRDGATWHTNGSTIPVGGFLLKEITADGRVIVGCHSFSKSEVLRFASVLGVQQ
jgi:hypothetical protein